jgi:hypothetical protein
LEEAQVFLTRRKKSALRTLSWFFQDKNVEDVKVVERGSANTHMRRKDAFLVFKDCQPPPSVILFSLLSLMDYFSHSLSISQPEPCHPAFSVARQGHMAKFLPME